MSQRAQSWIMRSPIYTYEYYKYITVRKYSLPNEFFLITFIKKCCEVLYTTMNAINILQLGKIHC